MKTTLLLLLLFISGFSHAQSFNDTLYYNSGSHRVVNVQQVTNNAILYQYKKKKGNICSGRIRKSMLGGYSIYNEHQTLLEHKEFKIEKDAVEPTQKSSGNARTGTFGVGFITGYLSAIATGLGIVLITW